MSPATTPVPATFRETLQHLAPGTELRDGLDRIVRGRTGALIIIGDGDEVTDLCDGGIEFDVPFAPTRLRELCKMDGAVILSTDASRIRRANVQVVPSPSYPTSESGTRHRSAERAALQTGRPVIAVSQSMDVITLYVEGQRYVLESPATILRRANQALGTLERYRTRLDHAACTSHSTTPIPSSTPAVRYWVAGRSTHGRTRNRQLAAPRTGRIVGARKCRCSTWSRRRTRAATFTIANTPSRSRAVVPPSSGTPPTKTTRPTASSVVNTIAT